MSQPLGLDLGDQAQLFDLDRLLPSLQFAQPIQHRGAGQLRAAHVFDNTPSEEGMVDLWTENPHKYMRIGFLEPPGNVPLSMGHAVAVSRPGARIDIRALLWSRVYAVAIVCVLISTIACVPVLHTTVEAIVVSSLLVCFGVVVAYRTLRLRVTSAAGGSLHVSNGFRSRLILRADIEEFRIDATGGARVGNLVVQVLLRDQTTYSLAVTASPALFGGRRTIRCLEQLEDWRTQY